MPTSRPSPREEHRRTKRLDGLFVAVLVLLVVGCVLVVKSCSDRVTRALEDLDGLRTDKTWRDTYRGMEPLDADAFLASFSDLVDPQLHPRMQRGVVVRGRVHFVRASSPGDPVVVLKAGPGIVRCRFDARRVERLEVLEPGDEVVIGGALVDVVYGVPELVACHFEDEWTRR